VVNGLTTTEKGSIAEAKITAAAVVAGHAGALDYADSV